MRAATSEKLEAGRIRQGLMGSTAEAGMAGAFMVIAPSGMELVIVSSGVDSEFNWEHVSVSLKHRTPNWSEMCFVKDLFWRDDECVVQFHPPKSEYVNHHPYCLHLWRPVAGQIETPPSHLNGSRDMRRLFDRDVSRRVAGDGRRQDCRGVRNPRRGGGVDCEATWRRSGKGERDERPGRVDGLRQRDIARRA